MKSIESSRRLRLERLETRTLFAGGILDASFGDRLPPHDHFLSNTVDTARPTHFHDQSVPDEWSLKGGRRFDTGANSFRPRHRLRQIESVGDRDSAKTPQSLPTNPVSILTADGQSQSAGEALIQPQVIPPLLISIPPDRTIDQAFEQTSFGPSPDVSANPIDRVANQLTAAFAATKTDEVSESEVEKVGVVASAEAIDTAFNQASVDLDPDKQKSPTNDDDLDFQADFGTKMDDQYPRLDFDDESYSYWLPLESINDFSKRNNQLEMPRELDDATLSAIRQIVRSSTANGFIRTAGRTLEMAASRLSFIAVHDVPLPQQMRSDVANPGTDSLAVRLKSVVMMTNSTTPFALANNTTINPELLDRILASLIDESVDNTDAEVQQAGVAVPNMAYPIAAVITAVAVSRYRNRKLGHATDWRHQSKGN